MLTLFGQGLGALRAEKEKITRDQHAFIKRAVRLLAQDRKVVCVRLSLFAEMVRDKPWTPATLEAVDGIEGIGVTFLEEKFTSANASPQYRLHREAAQKVFRALLPAAGADIKGHMRPVNDLLDASGYAAEPTKFDELIRILDTELRLITRTDPELVKSATKSGVLPAGGGERCYQLTHDYLVPVVRDWMNRKKKETRRGRAELALDECAAEWNLRRDQRYLPSLLQWVRFLWYVPRRQRTHVERGMLRRARRYHLTRVGVLAVLAAALCYTGYEVWQRREAASLRDQIIGANAAGVPAIVKDAGRYRPWLDPLLRRDLAEAAAPGALEAAPGGGRADHPQPQRPRAHHPRPRRGRAHPPRGAGERQGGRAQAAQRQPGAAF